MRAEGHRARPPGAFELPGADARLGAGWRARSLAEVGPLAWARRRELGVTRLAELTDLDRLGVPVVAAVRPGAPAGQNTSVQGCGRTREEAGAAALMEAVERHAAAAPRERRCAPVAALEAAGERLVSPRELGVEAPAAPLEWVRGQRLVDGAPTWVPAAEVLFPYHPPPGLARPVRPSTSGLAAGSGLAEATFHGLLEVVERHVTSRLGQGVWPARIPPSGLGGEAALLSARLEGEGVELLCLELRCHELRCHGLRCHESQGSGVPVVKVFALDRGAGQHHLAVSGQGAHLDPAAALLRALRELVQSRAVAIQGSREDLERHASSWADDPQTVEARFREVEALVGRLPPSTLLEAPAPAPPPTAGEALRLLRDRLGAATEGAVVTDLSTGPGGFAVAHVCVPGLWDRFVDPARGRDVRRG